MDHAHHGHHDHATRSAGPTTQSHAAQNSLNGLAWSATLTPTWQVKTLFVRGELSYTKLDSMGAGAGFGKLGNKDDQVRAMVETGVLF